MTQPKDKQIHVQYQNVSYVAVSKRKVNCTCEMRTDTFELRFKTLGNKKVWYAN